MIPNIIGQWHGDFVTFNWTDLKFMNDQFSKFRGFEGYMVSSELCELLTILGKQRGLSLFQIISVDNTQLFVFQKVPLTI